MSRAKAGRLTAMVVDPSGEVLAAARQLPELLHERQPGPEEALARALLLPPHVVLVAAELGGGWRGVDFAQEARRRGVTSPVVLVTPQEDEEAGDSDGVAVCVGLEAGPDGLRQAIEVACKIPADPTQERLLRSLAAFLNHEGKNALAGIGGAVQIISDSLPVESAERGICAEIRARLSSFSETLGTLQAVLRPLTSALTPLALRPLIDSAVELVGSSVDVSGDEAEVSGDPELLRHMFAAVVEGAGASPGSSITVHVRRTRQRCLVDVVDATAPSESEPWGALPLASSSRAGLGLPLAARIARAHGGTLRMICPRGSLRFRLELPARAQAPPAA